MTMEEAKKEAGKHSAAGDYPDEATVGDQGEREADDGASHAPADPGKNGNLILRERIARKAYELYERRGRRHGRHLEDWLEAERQVLVETHAARLKSKGKKARRRIYRPGQS
jgi:hypothetical protein